MISKLHYITQDIESATHVELVEDVCKAGVDWVQLRLKDKSYEEWKAIALEALAICRKYNAKLIINDNVSLAKEIGADGVHVGKQDMPVAKAREILGADFIIGGTANTFEDVKLHATSGADYIGLGPFRFTSTKQNLSPILGLDGYQIVANWCKQENINVPIIAIGGIISTDVESLFHTGVHGVAIASALTHAGNKTEVVKEFKSKFPIEELGDAKFPSLEGLGVGKRTILPYNQNLIKLAKELRKNSTLSEVLLWKELKGKQRKGFDFDRQRVIGNYIVDFYCKDLMLAIEIDGNSHDAKYEADKNRQDILENMGVHFLRFADEKVKQDMLNVLREIDLWLEQQPTPNPSKEGNFNLSNL